MDNRISKSVPRTRALGFLGLFQEHWEKGTGLGTNRQRPSKCWTIKDFTESMRRAQCPISEDAVGNWIKGINLPRRPQMLAIVNVFFPATDLSVGDPHPERSKMETAWDNDNKPKRNIKIRPLNYSNDFNEDERSKDWPRKNPQPIVGLAELELMTPHLDNASGGYRIRGRLIIGEREDDQGYKNFIIALREAFLTIACEPMLVTDGTLIGIREEHNHLKPAPGGLKIIGPLNERGVLDGEIFSKEHLIVITQTERKSDNNRESEVVVVTVTISAFRRSFVVNSINQDGFFEEPIMPSEAKNAVLDALIFSALPRDEAGRAILQHAQIWRQTKE